MPDKHSKYFSPSAASRWLNCLGSALKCADLPQQESKYASRGTNLHTFCEKSFELDRAEIDFSTLPPDDVDAAKSALLMADNLFNQVGATEYHLELEVSVLEREECFGTVDLVFYNAAEKHLVIADYKFGYGYVSPDWNDQLLIYALGARRHFAYNGIDHITLAIIQPEINTDAPEVFSLTNAELNNWQEQRFDPAYFAIIDGKTGLPLTPGEKQCKWCKAKPCEALDKVVEDALNAEPGHNVLELSATLDRIAMIRDWCSAKEAEAIRRMTSGEKIPNYKLVRKRTNRRWSNTEEAEKFLRLRGLKEKERCSFKVISITQAEKILKDRDLTQKNWNAFNRLIEKPEGDVTYAPIDDSRDAVVFAPPEELVGASLLDEIM